MSRAPPQPDLFSCLDAEEPRLPRLRVRRDEVDTHDPPVSDEIEDHRATVAADHFVHDEFDHDVGSSISGASAERSELQNGQHGRTRASAGTSAAAKKAKGARGGGARSITPKPRASTVSARMTITLPKGPVLAAIKREAAKEGLSVSQASFRALARGARRADLDVEDRLNRLEASLAAHRKATARDFALTQELVAALAQLICERLPVRDLPPMLKAAATRDVEAMLRRVVDAAGRG
ncbi:MAG: hypothetical protein ACOYJ6_16200 [Caulobacterales bacterium]